MDCIELQILLFDKSHWSFAKSFWQHTGDGVSSRMAERALSFMGEGPAGSTVSPPPVPENSFKPTSRNRHYARRTPRGTSSALPSVTPSTPATPATPTTASSQTQQDDDEEERIESAALTTDLTTYLEERYGRNLPLFNSGLAKQALRRRIAGGLLPSDEDYGKVQVSRGLEGQAVTEEDVYLYPCGMSAIWHAFDIVRKACAARGETETKSVCFG